MKLPVNDHHNHDIRVLPFVIVQLAFYHIHGVLELACLLKYRNFCKPYSHWLVLKIHLLYPPHRILYRNKSFLPQKVHWFYLQFTFSCWNWAEEGRLNRYESMTVIFWIPWLDLNPLFKGPWTTVHRCMHHLCKLIAWVFPTATIQTWFSQSFNFHEQGFSQVHLRLLESVIF